jgi:Carboxypeptidase regulatory-like domain/TonB-dependent Receptor Plug Domain/TonB dependent receptor
MITALKRLGVLSVALFFSCLPMLPQAGVATLSGLVTDASRASIAGARVTARNQSTGISRSTVTDGSGYYNFASLPIGKYDISVEQAGFDSSQQAVMLDPSAKLRQDFQLFVSGTKATVNVIATPPELSRDDASIGTVVENQTIITTPLFMRNWDDLIRLVPGVQAQRYTEQSGGTASGRTGSFNIHGIDSLQNNFIMDGIDNNTFSENVQELSTEASRPSVDVISEFKVISSPYTAEYGRSPGAVVDVTTKGGTNEVHGLLFEYLRNRVFDSNDFFSNKSGLSKPENVQNQFGGNVGAPIIKNKLFGFFDYEGTRIRRGITRISTVPLPNERAGDYSLAAAAANGLTYPTIKNPTTGAPFPNNIIPASLIDPYGQKLLNLFPLPNQAGELNNFARTGSLIDDTDSYDGRVDWNASEKDLAFGRFTSSNRTRDIPGNFGGIADGSSTSAWGNSTLKSYSAVVGWTHTFGPQLVNDFRLGFIRNFAYDQQQPFGLNPASEFVPGVPNNPAVAGGVSQTSFDNYTSIGSPDFLPKQQVPQQWNYTDALSWNRGRHTLKFGVDVRAPMRNIYQDEASTRGTLEFSGQFSGLSYTDGLLGYVRQGTLNNVYFVDQRLWMASGFVQDDWKVSPKLTLNLGLRYEFATPAVDGKNQQANFNPAGGGSLYYATSGSLQDRALVQVNDKNFAPRVGFAYAANDKTVIRGGYGIYNLLFWRNGSENQLALNPPFLRQTTLTGTNTSPAFLLQNGFPPNLLDPANINYSLTHIRAIDPNSSTPYVQQWSFGIQRTLPAQMVLTADYVGTKSTHLDIIHDLNQYQNRVFPYPNFGYLEYQQPFANGSYNGLEVSVQRRFQNGLSLNVAYTCSKSIQTMYEQTFTRAPSGFDVPQRVVASYVFELPFGKGKPFVTSGIGSRLLGGWRTAGVYTFSSGLPFTVTSGSAYNNAIDAYGAATALPNVIGTPQIVGNVNCWFYASANKACQALAPGLTNAFALQQVGQYGNAGANILRAPHATVFDFSLMRDFAIRERTSLQLRWETFNLTNTPMFSTPNTNLSSGSVGAITTLAGDPRVMQFALRLSF